VLAVAALVGCVEPVPEGTTGRLGKVVFQAPTDLVWSSRLATGSTFVVTAVARTKKNTLGEEARVASDNVAIVVVDDVEFDDGALRFRMVAQAPGAVDLVVSDDNIELDRIRIETARAVETSLVDAALVGATDAVDPRLPADFALVANGTARVLVSAVDRCGEPLLDLGASTLVLRAGEGVEPASVATIAGDAPASFVVTTAAAESFVVGLVTPGLADLDYGVSVVSRAAIDEVHAVAAVADAEAGSVTLWGRAFVDDVEVIGQDFTWASTERVALSTTVGPSTTATIAFPSAGEPADDRPATVTAEIVGEEGTVDLLALTAEELVGSRGEPPARPASDDANRAEEAAETAAEAGGCGGVGSPCDPFAATAPIFLWARRRRRHA
jgi:hypothetical protein